VHAFSLPSPLSPGDRIRLIAPASPFDRTLFFRGAGFLAERYRVELGEHVLSRKGFLAGTDAERLHDLNAALESADVKAIVAARGGYGSGRIVAHANWSALERSPKWLVGFSDITLLHQEAQRVGLCSLHGENAAGLGRGSESTRSLWVSTLEHPDELASYAGLTKIRGGNATGPLVGGNLTLLFTAQAAGRLFLPEGAVLAIEDVTEQSYRVDRMLTALTECGALGRVAAVVVGDFTDCGEGPHRVPVEDVLVERLARLGVPVASGLPFGHGARNDPLILGRRATLDADQGTLTFSA
jgi:muramoyltetrapeptide carboxypeptidase